MPNTPLQEIPNFDKFQIVKEGVGTLPTSSVSTVGAGYASGVSSVTYTHNLGFVPIPMAVINVSGVYYPIAYTQTSANVGVNNMYIITISMATSSTGITFFNRVTVNTSASGGVSFGGYSIRYWLTRKSAD